MALMQWSERLSVGVPQIDNEHARLVEVLNDLHAAMVSGKADQATHQILARLVEYTKEHFAREEQLMARHRYPGLAAHKREHEVLIKKVEDFQQQLASKRMALSVGLLQFLKEWLNGHISGSDRALSGFLTTAARV